MNEMTEKDFYKWVGKRLKELREKSGIKQKNLAEETGIDATFISRVENNGKKISAYQLNKLLYAMGFTQADLTDDVDVKKNSPSLSMATT
jgi:transcriptional regulator with XRE-family HTH domain